MPPTTAPGVETTVDKTGVAGTVVAGTVVTRTAAPGAVVSGTVPGIVAVTLPGTTGPTAEAGTDVTGTVVTGTNPGIAPVPLLGTTIATTDVPGITRGTLLLVDVDLIVAKLLLNKLSCTWLHKRTVSIQHQAAAVRLFTTAPFIPGPIAT